MKRKYNSNENLGESSSSASKRLTRQDNNPDVIPFPNELKNMDIRTANDLAQQYRDKANEIEDLKDLL